MSEKKQMGFSRLDITPLLGKPIPGYFETRLGNAVLDPLYVNALAFREGDKAAVLMVCDLLGCYGKAGPAWQACVSEATGLPQEAVFICHTHTHTGGPIEPPETNPWLAQRLCDAARLALDDCKDVTEILVAGGEATDMAHVRRYKRADGEFQTWSSLNEKDIVGHASEVDNSLRVIRVERDGAPEIVIGSFQVHPDNVGGCGYSADYPASFRSRIEEKRPGCRCVFLDGAEGQQVRNDPAFGINVPKSHAVAMEYGEKLADFALKLYDQATPIAEDTPFAADMVVERIKSRRDDSRIPECRRILALHRDGGDGELHPRRGEQIYMVAEATQLIHLTEDQQDYLDLKVTVITFGGLAFVGFPGEPFNEMGVWLRERSPYPMTCVCCQTNGSEGYIATAEGYDQGGYEPRNSKMAKGVAEQLVDSAVAILNRMHGESR